MRIIRSCPVKIKILVILSVILFACQNESRWYPSADVTISNQYEYTDAQGGHKLAVTILVHNTCDTSILSGTVTLKVVTNKREYIQSISFNNSKIIPGGKVALTIVFSYLESNEAFISGGISVYNSFFD